MHAFYEGPHKDRNTSMCPWKMSRNAFFPTQATFQFPVTRLCFPDVDECSLQTHTCWNHSVCVNLPGGYDCVCTSGPGCSGDCPQDKGIRRNGEDWKPSFDRCAICSCKVGSAWIHSPLQYGYYTVIDRIDWYLWQLWVNLHCLLLQGFVICVHFFFVLLKEERRRRRHTNQNNSTTELCSWPLLQRRGQTHDHPARVVIKSVTYDSDWGCVGEWPTCGPSEDDNDSSRG